MPEDWESVQSEQKDLIMLDIVKLVKGKSGIIQKSVWIKIWLLASMFLITMVASGLLISYKNLWGTILLSISPFFIFSIYMS